VKPTPSTTPAIDMAEAMPNCDPRMASCHV
jgi:hypothetical protein